MSKDKKNTGNKTKVVKMTAKEKAMTAACLMVIVAFVAVLGAAMFGKNKADADIQATDKIVHTVEIALANQDIYDEVIAFAYESNMAGYNTDETMKGVTITFEPIDQGTYLPPEAVINKLVGGTDRLRELVKLNNYVQQNIGDAVELTHYTDTEYTIFIKMGETKNEVEVYGAFDVKITE